MRQALRCDQKPNSAVNIMWQLFQNFPMIHLGTSYIQKSLLSCIYGKASSTWSCAVIRLITLLWKFISDKKRALKSLVISTLMLHGSRLVIFFFFLIEKALQIRFKVCLQTSSNFHDLQEHYEATYFKLKHKVHLGYLSKKDFSLFNKLFNVAGMLNQMCVHSNSYVCFVSFVSCPWPQHFSFLYCNHLGLRWLIPMKFCSFYQVPSLCHNHARLNVKIYVKDWLWGIFMVLKSCD